MGRSGAAERNYNASRLARRVYEGEFTKESSGPGSPLTLGDLGIRSREVLEVDLQHEDMELRG